MATSDIFGKVNAYKTPLTAFYVTGDGFICEGGNDRQEGRAIADE